MISDELSLKIMKECDFNDYTFASPHNETESCNDAMSEANSIIGDYINNYDVILDVCYPSIVAQELRLRKMVRSLLPVSFFVHSLILCPYYNTTTSADGLFLFQIHSGYQDKYWC